MNSDKYIGMDVHQATTVIVVLDAEGRLVLETIVATEAAAIIRLLQSLAGTLRVTFEETTQAAWLHDVIRHLATAFPGRARGDRDRADTGSRRQW